MAVTEMTEDNEDTCFFCGSHDVILPEVGIALGIGGDDYSFCQTCLQEMTALKFWMEFFKKNGYTWPPKIVGGWDLFEKQHPRIPTSEEKNRI